MEGTRIIPIGVGNLKSGADNSPGSGMELVGKLAILFSAFGALAGCVFAPIKFPGGLPGFFAGLLLFFGMFYVAYRVTPAVLKIPHAEFPGGKWSGLDAIKRGFVFFFIAWLILWILVYTLLL